MGTSLNDIKNLGDSDTSALLIQEYQSLRDEMIRRTEMRQRIVELTILSAGAVLAVDTLDTPFERVLLVYPILVMFLAAAWVHHGMFQMKLGSYLREIVEPVLGNQNIIEVNVIRNNRMVVETRRLGYERDISRFAPHRQEILGWLSSFGLFLSIQLMSIWLGWEQAQHTKVNVILLILGVMSLVITILVLCLKRLPVSEDVKSALSSTSSPVP